MQTPPDQPADTATVTDWRAWLVTQLNLPAETDDAALTAKVAEILTGAASAGDSATKLAAANTELERVQAEYKVLMDREREAYEAKRAAEIDAILEQYADRLTDEKAKARIRAILEADRDAGMDILNGLPAPASAAPEKKDTPPAPQYDPAAEDKQGKTPEQKAAEAEALIATVRKEGKFTDYTSAREEARRRQPELFS